MPYQGKKSFWNSFDQPRVATPYGDVGYIKLRAFYMKTIQSPAASNSCVAFKKTGESIVEEPVSWQANSNAGVYYH